MQLRSDASDDEPVFKSRNFQHGGHLSRKSIDRIVKAAGVKAGLTVTMQLKNQQTAITTKIKKWVEAAKQLSTNYTGFALPITRLTSIKSLCKVDAQARSDLSSDMAAEKFALYISKMVLQQAKDAECPDNTTPEEWEIHKSLMTHAITHLDCFLDSPTPVHTQSLWSLLKQIDELQGDDYRNVHWTTVHFVKSGYLLKFKYAICCFVKPEFDYYAYRLAREYTECYAPTYGKGLTPDSVPMLLEVAEFWCQYYFEQSLEEKFPNLMN